MPTPTLKLRRNLSAIIIQIAYVDLNVTIIAGRTISCKMCLAKIESVPLEQNRCRQGRISHMTKRAEAQGPRIMSGPQNHIEYFSDSYYCCKSRRL